MGGGSAGAQSQAPRSGRGPPSQRSPTGGKGFSGLIMFSCDHPMTSDTIEVTPNLQHDLNNPARTAD